MKKIKRNLILTIMMLLFSLVSIAQNAKTVIGNYKEKGASYFIQENHTFIIVGYATLITGKWSIENNILKLIPKNPDFPFLLYGFHNPSVVGTKIMFSGFDDDNTFVGLGKPDNMQRVFNEGVNCTSFPNVHLFKNAANKISFACDSDITNKERKLYTYTISNDFNDFVAYYIPQSNFRDPIILKINKKGLENRFQEKLSIIKELSNGDVEMIKDINKSLLQEDNVTYYNSSYNCIAANKITLEKYNFNKSKNAYVSKKKENTDNPFHNLNVIYKYNKIENVKTSNVKIEVVKKPLFHFECK